MILRCFDLYEIFQIFRRIELGANCIIILGKSADLQKTLAAEGIIIAEINVRTLLE